MQHTLSRLIRLVAITLVAVALGVSAHAQEFKARSLVIERPWIRATPGGAKIAGGYLTITNKGTEPDRIVGGSIPGSSRVEIHEMKMESGVMQMRPLTSGLEIKPGQTVKFEPGSYHLMFMKLTQPFKQGEMLKGQLRFEKAGTIDVTFMVEGVGAAGPSGHGH